MKFSPCVILPVLVTASAQEHRHFDRPTLGGHMRGRTTLATGCAALLVFAVGGSTGASSPAGHHHHPPANDGFKHLVVIYEENHSFDNLYGGWGSVDGQHVDGLADAEQPNTTQVAQNGDAYGCLLQNDVN